GGRCSLGALMLQSTVLRATTILDEAITDLLPHVLMATVVMPLVATVQ
ncbi:Odorant receptor 80, partial [Frankliniella occidentalis]